MTGVQTCALPICRIPEESEDSYPTVKKFTREEEEEDSSIEEIEEIKLPEIEKNDSIDFEAAENTLFQDISEDTVEENSQLFEEIPVETENKEDTGIGEISKNEEFLKALKDFRDSL